MDIQALTTFFMLCTIINGALLIVWTVFFLLFPEFMYRTQARWVPVPREQFRVIMYAFLGLFKMFFLVFSLVPYLALLIMG